MPIGILYESMEWSNFHLAELINNRDVECLLIDMQKVRSRDRQGCRLYVNRVFPSAAMRNHYAAINNTQQFLKDLADSAVPVINDKQVFSYDCSKNLYYEEITRHCLAVPEWALFSEDTLPILQNWDCFPAIIKPDCGGRSYQTTIIRNKTDLINWKPAIRNYRWIIQQYVAPKDEFIIRVEVIGEEIIGVFKRFVGQQDISSYSRGSRYVIYPDCKPGILQQAVDVMRLLNMDMGGIDFIEDTTGVSHLIDINPSSNFTPDLNYLYGFDPIDKMADYILEKYQKLISSSPS